MFFMTELWENTNNLDERVNEYLRLYRGFVRAVERVTPTLKVGGPATAGCIPFCKGFLEAIKAEKLKFDFFSGHAYGTDRTKLNSNGLPFDTKSVIEKIKVYQDLLDSYFPDAVTLWGRI